MGFRSLKACRRGVLGLGNGAWGWRSLEARIQDFKYSLGSRVGGLGSGTSGDQSAGLRIWNSEFQGFGFRV